MMAQADPKQSNIQNPVTTSRWPYRILVLSAVLLLLFITWLVFIEKNTLPDERVFDTFSGSVTESRSQVMLFITALGNHKFLIPANLSLIFFFLWKKRNHEALNVLIIALSSLGMMSLLKNLFQRERPFNPFVEGITNYSFPSGHAFMSVAFFGLLVVYFIRYVESKWLQLILISILFLLVFGIGISRIYLRVHYSTDVLAGWICGALWLAFCFELLKRIKRKSPAGKI